jgi:hypothetical protein
MRCFSRRSFTLFSVPPVLSANRPKSSVPSGRRGASMQPSPQKIVTHICAARHDYHSPKGLQSLEAGKTYVYVRYEERDTSDSAEDMQFLRSLNAADLSRLVDLDVEMWTHEDEALVAELVSKAPNLEAFTLRGNLTDLVVYAVAAHCPRLRQVDLSLLYVSTGALTALASRCPEVEEVVAFSGSKRDYFPDSIVKLHSMLPLWGRLRRLTVCEIEVQNSTLAELGRNCPQLEYFETWGCPTVENPVSDVGVAALAQGCPRLRYLRIPICSDDVIDAGVVAVAKHCSLLEHLNLSRTTSITNIAISAIATLPLLRCLKLPETAVDSTCIVPLGEGCPRMEEFRASITDPSVMEMVLPHWPRLKKLHLGRMVPTASLFAALGRHNPEVEWVVFQDSGDTSDFTASLSGGASLVKAGYGRWVRSTSCMPSK